MGKVANVDALEAQEDSAALALILFSLKPTLWLMYCGCMMKLFMFVLEDVGTAGKEDGGFMIMLLI
jgi:hypothetical protein